jgi:hypothetical protein
MITSQIHDDGEEGDVAMKTLVLIGLLYSLVTAASALAGTEVVSGAEPGFWTLDRFNLVIGVIRDVKKFKDPQSPSNDRYSATLTLKASLAGQLDPSLIATLDVMFYAEHYGSSIKTVPTEGMVVMALVRLRPSATKDAGPKDMISSAFASFMPGECSLVEIKSLDDPRVDETLKKIQNARAHPDPDPNAPKPATKPATPSNPK